MRHISALFFILLLSSSTLWGAQVNITSQSFGMDMTAAVVQRADPWPTPRFGSIRLLEDLTGWAEINTAGGTYDFTPLDTWFLLAAQHGNPELIFNFSLTPQFISNHSTDTTTCAYTPYIEDGLGGGACYPPADLNVDGSGTDATWKAFVSTVVKHVGSKITYYEMWNTPQDHTQWRGTLAQLVRLTADASAIIKAANPNAKILPPPVGAFKLTNTPSNACFPANNLGKYLATMVNGVNGAHYIDIVSFHGYFGNPPLPEDILPLIACLRNTMSQYGLASKPLWNTEGGWGLNSLLTNTGIPGPAWLARSFLIQLSAGVQRYHWYDYDNTSWGTLWKGSLNTTGIAYEQVYNWLVGATMTRPCAATTGTSTWTCPITRTSPYKALAVWNTVGTTSYTVPSGFTQYRDLTGKVTATSSGATITIGVAPLLLEN